MSRLPNSFPVSDGSASNVLVPNAGFHPTRGNRARGAVDPEADYIEGEGGVSGEVSGFSCERCLGWLPVGSAVCPHCGMRFLVPTPLRSRIPLENSPTKMKAMLLITNGRLIDEDVPRRRAFRQSLRRR